MQDQSQGLYGFTQAHVIGEQRTEIVFEHESQPAITFHLVGAHGGSKALRQFELREIARVKGL